jgi:hypothetical protein
MQQSTERRDVLYQEFTKIESSTQNAEHGTRNTEHGTRNTELNSPSSLSAAGLRRPAWSRL